MRIIATLICCCALFGADVPLRTRAQVFKDTDQWEEVTLRYPLRPSRTAVVVCDMWDDHWCRGAAGRVNNLAVRMNQVLEKARASGILIIHAPSDTMDFYRSDPRRKAILEMNKVDPVSTRELDSPKLPIDDSDGGCDTDDKTFKAWTREHPAIRIAPQDLISDRGDEIYSALKLRGITDLLVMGVHTNMCILNRSFAIKQMTKWGVRCMLVRDLTDAMYDPKDSPHVSHEQGTELVIEHIEKYWCPTLLSRDLLDALPQ